MRRIYVCVSIQRNAEETVQFARACCSFVWDKGFLPMASHYMCHNESQNIIDTEGLDDNSDYLEMIRAHREELKLSDEAWFFIKGEKDAPMIMDYSMAFDLEIPVHTYSEEELCSLNVI